MPLVPGSRLATYEIAGLLGVGGMGEVYRARDVKLEREVAVKLLRESLAHDRECRARFEREAKLLAAMNHPGIAILHAVEEDSGRLLLVMELVEGETLAEKIARGPSRWVEARPWFVQIAHALAAAHAKGILHRDLKPANIKITREGRVKILDFGLAKLTEPEPDLDSGLENLSNSPTINNGRTAAGAILGTASYMSPEQARGDPVDRRTDIWAFGCCLYEALTGDKAFSGGTATDVLVAIMKSEPDLSRLPLGTPVAVERAVRRSLTKDPARRLHDFADVRIELEEDQDQDQTQGESLSRTVPRVEPRRFEITFPPGEGPETLAVSPDGRRVVYSSMGDGTPRLFVRDLDRLESRVVPDTELGFVPIFSPDGKEIAFHAGVEPGRIRRVRVEGGTPVDIVRSRYTWWAGMDWGPDDAIVFSQGSLGLSRVAVDRGKAEILTEVDGAAGERFHIEPHFLPGGSTVLFTVVFENGDLRTEALNLATKERSVVEGVGPFARFVETGHLLYPKADSILVVPFDPDARRPVGRLTPLGFPVERRLEGLRQRPPFLDWSSGSGGTLVYFAPGSIASRSKSFVWVERNGIRTVIGRTDSTKTPWPRLSPDGGRLAFTSENLEIWVQDIVRGSPPLRLTFEGDHRWPLWSPDGKRLAFMEGGASVVNVVTLASDGSETEPQRIASFPRERVPTQIFPACWTPDEEDVLVFDGETVWVLAASGRSEPRRLFDTPFHQHAPAIAPDGRLLAYLSDRSGSLQVFVSPYPDVTSRPPLQISRNGGFEPRWSRDGRELYFREGKRLMVAPIDNGTDGPHARTPTALFELRSSPPSPVVSVFDVAPDGRFLVLEDEAPKERSHAVVVENWFAELERLAPK